MKKQIMSIITAASVILSVLTPATTVFAASTTQSMYRMYNWNSGEHFYTASVDERNHLVDVGWNYEGIGWNAPLTGMPVYRLYNPNVGDHHYTTSARERDYLVSAGWRYEKTGWYSGGPAPLYRQYNPNAATGTHNYTTSPGERNALVKLGWRDEGISWYGERPEKGNSEYRDGTYFAETHNAGMEEIPEYHIDSMSISDNKLIVSGSFERMNSSWDANGAIEGQRIEFPLRSDTLFYQIPEEDEVDIMSASDYVRNFNNGNIGPAVNIHVQNGYVIKVSSGS